MTLGDIAKKAYNLGEIGEMLENEIEEKLNAGILTKEAADAFLGRTDQEIQEKNRGGGPNRNRLPAWKNERPEKLHADSARSKDLPGKSQSDSGVIRKSSKQGVSKEPAVNTSTLKISPTSYKI